MERDGSALSRAPRFEPPLLPYRPARRARRPEYPQAEASPRTQPCRLSRGTDSTGRSGPPGIRRAMAASHSAHPPETDPAAQIFVERALRLALEILDHRRPVAQFARIATPSVVAAIQTLVRADLAPSRTLGAAVLGRVDLAMVDANTAEVCARYSRGQRYLAVAARIAYTRAGGWRLVVFRVL